VKVLFCFVLIGALKVLGIVGSPQGAGVIKGSFMNFKSYKEDKEFSSLQGPKNISEYEKN
jgi:hypothetical protein